MLTPALRDIGSNMGCHKSHHKAAPCGATVGSRWSRVVSNAEAATDSRLATIDPATDTLGRPRNLTSL